MHPTCTLVAERRRQWHARAEIGRCAFEGTTAVVTTIIHSKGDAHYYTFERRCTGCTRRLRVVRTICYRQCYCCTCSDPLLPASNATSPREAAVRGEDAWAAAATTVATRCCRAALRLQPAISVRTSFLRPRAALAVVPVCVWSMRHRQAAMQSLRSICVCNPGDVPRSFGAHSMRTVPLYSLSILH